MKPDMGNDERIPTGLAGRINPICDKFEADWKAGPRPRLEDFLAQGGEPDRRYLFHELLDLELRYRRQQGERPAPEEYRRSSFRQYDDIIDALFPALPSTGPEVPVSPSLVEPGMLMPQLPGYEILERLGHGGMGIVYKAQKIDSGRLVAVKVLKDNLASQELLARFRREHQILDELNHQHILKVYGVGEWEPGNGGIKLPYLILEYIEGHNLEQRLGQQAAEPVEAARLVWLLAGALQAIHTKGIIHRDLTPNNVLLAPATDQSELNCLWGCPKLADFGLARRLDSSSFLTKPRAVMGTPNYMAPEQAKGEGVEKAADVYGLGTILYRMLTGQPPFKGRTFEILYRVCSESPPPPRQWNPTLPDTLERLCLWCLAKIPAVRPTVERLIELLDMFLRGEHATMTDRLPPRATVLAWCRSGINEPIPAQFSSGDLQAFGDPFPGHLRQQRFDRVPLEYFECKSEVVPIERLTDEALQTAQDLFPLAKEAQADRDNKQFDDNDLLGVASWRPGRIDIDKEQDRVRLARFGFRHVKFFNHILLGEYLDKDISEWFKGWLDEGGWDHELMQRVKEFVRKHPRFVPAEQLGVDTNKLTLCDAPKWPMLPFRLGLAVVIITSDKPRQVLVPLRSNLAYLGDKGPSDHAEKYTSSVGEGMARNDTERGLHSLLLKGLERQRARGVKLPEGAEERQRQAVENSSERPSLLTLAARALLDEMGIEHQVDCDVGREVLCVALNFDRHEAFPYLTTILEADLTYEEIKALRKQKAKDDEIENKDVFGLEWNEETAEKLAQGEIEVAGVGKLVAASLRERIFFAQAAETLGFGW